MPSNINVTIALIQFGKPTDLASQGYQKIMPLENAIRPHDLYRFSSPPTFLRSRRRDSTALAVAVLTAAAVMRRAGVSILLGQVLVRVVLETRPWQVVVERACRILIRPRQVWLSSVADLVMLPPSWV